MPVADVTVPDRLPPVPRLRVHVNNHGDVPLLGDELRVIDVRRFNLDLDGSETARRETNRRWTENWGEDQTQPTQWDVTEMVLETGGTTSTGAAEESLRVWFSPYESEAALRHVFGPLKVRLHSIVLVRLGGFSCQRHRPEMDHHIGRFFSLLSRYARVTGTGLPDFVLKDRATSDWGDPDPYVPTGVAYQGWEGPVNDDCDPGVRLLTKREGELAVPRPRLGLP